MAPIHDWMPVILKPDDWWLWFAPDANLERVIPLVEPADSVSMVTYPVSRKVSNAREEGPGLIDRIEAEPA